MALLSNINGKFVVEQTTGYVGVGTTDPSYPIEVLNASAEIALNASGGSIYRVQSDNASNFIIRKEGVGDRLVINSTGNATFSGMITVNGGGIDIDNNDDVRLRFDNASVFKAGLQVATTAGDMIAGSAVNDFAIRSQENMLFATGGNTERMRIDSSGALLVGGTASPSTSWKGTAVFGQQGTNKVIIGYLSAFSENVVGGHNSALDAWDSLTLAGTDFKFRTGSGATDTSMVIDSSGNVGIGTTSPDLTGFGWNCLSVVGGTTAGSAGVLELGSPTTNANAQNLGIIAFMDGSTRNAQIDVARATSTSTANMSFYTNGGSGIVERMRIDSAGKVSVGSPVVGQLGVRGTTNDSTAYSFESANLSGNTLFAVRNDGLSFFPSGNVGIGLTSPASKLDINGGRIGIRNNIVAASNLTYSTIYSTENSGAAYPFTGTSGNLVVEPRNGQDFVVLGTSGVARMVVKGATGRVGIGTNDPQAALDISSNYSIQGGVRTYAYQGTAAGTTNINLDITVGNEGGQGNVFKIEAGFAHYYAMNYNSVAEWWCTSRGTAVINTYILNAGSTLGGDWSASKPSTTVLRITKSAGTYGGTGKYWVKVTYVPF